MSTLKKLASAMKPILEKDDISNHCDLILNTHKKVLASSNIFSGYFNKYPFDSIQGKTFNEKVIKSRSIHDIMYRNLPLMIEGILKYIPEVVDKIRDHVEANFPDTLATASITYNKVNVLRLLELIDFWMHYSSKMMNYIVSWELASKEVGEPHYSKGFVKDLENNFKSYLIISGILSKRPKDIISIINKIPDDIIVTRDSFTSSVSQSKVDPMKMNLVPIRFNLAYYALDLLADLSINRYDSLIAQREELEVSIQYLEDLKEGGKLDARKEKILENKRNIYNKIEAKIKKAEEEIDG